MGPEYGGEDRRDGPDDRRFQICPNYETCPARTKEHLEDHHMVRSAMKVLARLDSTRWAVFNTVAIVLVLYLFGSLGLGLLQKLSEALKL